MPPSQISPNYSIHFPPTFRKSLPKPPCPVPASGLPFSRAGGCMGLSRPNAWLSPATVTPLLLVHPHMDLADPTARLDCCRLPHSMELCQPARQLSRPTLCFPETHYLVTPVVPITFPTWRSARIWVLAIAHLAPLPGSAVQNLTC